MLFIVHVLIGAVIGLYFSSAFVVIPVAFLSHFFLDCIPHWGLGFDNEDFKKNYNAKLRKKTLLYGGIDGLVAVILIFFMFGRFSSGMLLLGCMASVFPDILSLGYFTKIKHKKKYKKFLHFHNNIQKEAGFFIGMLIQMIIILVLIKILF
jgi:hypothetical protein